MSTADKIVIPMGTVGKVTTSNEGLITKYIFIGNASMF